MEFKIHDKVRVIDIYEGGHEDCLGATGTIVDIDPDWVFPYEIEFDDGKKYSKDLFLEKEISLLVEDVKDYINIKFKNGQSDGAKVSDVIDILLVNLKIRHNNSNNLGMNYHLNIINAIARLTEAKMWAEELDK